jgi:biopolymer transport protein TolQ
MIIATNPILDSYFQSDLFGKGIFLGLLLLSILTWVVFLKKGFYIKNLQQAGHSLEEQFKVSEAQPLSLDLQPKEHPCSALHTHVKRKSIELLHKNRSSSKSEESYLFSSDIDLLDAQIASMVSKEVGGLEKDLFLLSTIISLAPFLGLLGTVWGILLTFAELHANHLMEKSSLVMGGLSMALGTTVVGLLVAIPALIGYNYLKSKIAQFESLLNDFGTLLLSSVEFHYRKTDA